MSILVTGSTGILGSNLVRKLIERYEKVRVLIRKTSNTTGIDGLKIERKYGDITDYDSVKEAMRGCRSVYHVASSTSLRSDVWDLLYKTNVTGTRNVARAAIEEGIEKMVYTSSASSAGWGTMENPAHEDMEWNLEDAKIPYYHTKREAEDNIFELCKKEGLPAVVVNPTMIFGKWDVNISSGQVILLINKIPYITLNTGGNFISAEDVAMGHIYAMEKGKIGERYILGNANMPLKDFYKLVKRILSIKSPTLIFPASFAIPLGYLSNIFQYLIPDLEISRESMQSLKYPLYFSSEKAVSQLGIPQTPIEQAVEQEIKWLRDQKLI